MKIGVVGVGKVGGAISFGFKRIGHEVLQHDVKLDTRLKDVLPAPIIFICVPTPSAPDGSCVTHYVKAVVRELSSAEYGGLVVIKSTVPPGTTDKCRTTYPKSRFAFCPEFLRERAAFSDFVENNDVCISGVHYDRDAELIEQAHGSLPKAFVRMRPVEAEFCKYFCNTFNALRIVFANQFYDVCRAAGADYSVIKNAVVKRYNIGNHYLECNEQFREFGGSCLPKDTSAFVTFVKSIGVDAPLFDQIVRLNEQSHIKNPPDEQAKIIHTEITTPNRSVGIDLYCTEQHLIDHQGTGYVYEPDIMAAILNFIRPGDVCIDAGANLGYHSILMAKLAGASGKVLAFEPDPDCLQKLNNNLVLNGVADYCLQIPLALWDSSGLLTFYTAKCGYGSILTFVNLQQTELEVKACTLDDAINPDLYIRMMKIDCEGAEEQILHGAEKLLKRGVDAVIVELNYNILDRMGVTDKPIRQYMNSLGYELYFLFGNGIYPERIALDTIIERSAHRFHFNGLFCKENVLKETWKLSTVGTATVWPPEAK